MIELTRYGLRCYEAANYRKALRVFRALASAMPERALSWSHLALPLVSLGEYEEAAQALHRSLMLDVSQVETWSSLASTLLQLNAWPEAEQACAGALSIDPEHAVAWQILGIARSGLDAHPGAAEAFAKAIEFGGESPGLCANLGATLMKCGRFSEAQRWLDTALAQADLEAVAEAKRLCDLILAAVAGEVPAAPLKYYKTALLLLDSAGERDAAMRIAEAWAAAAPDDVEARHLRDAICSRPVERQSAALVAQRFDEMAETFDQRLVERLAYRGPERLLDLLAGRLQARSDLEVLDLGCGTGLSGEVLRPYARRLVGVDLSAKMLDQARARDLYDGLELADLLDVLSQPGRSWDLIVALDTLPYLGALEELFDAAATALAPGGWFAFSTEIAEGEGYLLRGNGRFAHAPAYVAGAAAGRFEIVAHETGPLRREGGKPVDGGFFLLRALG